MDSLKPIPPNDQTLFGPFSVMEHFPLRIATLSGVPITDDSRDRRLLGTPYNTASLSILDEPLSSGGRKGAPPRRGDEDVTGRSDSPTLTRSDIRLRHGRPADPRQTARSGRATPGADRASTRQELKDAIDPLLTVADDRCRVISMDVH
jgi:hypothetical protein